MGRVLLFTVDVEEFVLPEEYGRPFDIEEAYRLGASGLERLGEVLARHAILPTLFATSGFARRYPELLSSLLARGAELALHAEEHTDDYRAMPPNEARARLGRARAALQETFGVQVEGYRANRFRSPSRSILRELGILWTSNLHPTWVPGAYDHRDRPRTVHLDEGLLEVPISVTPTLRLPLSWFWIRNLGLAYACAAAGRASRDTGYLNLYVHPWEFAKLPPLPRLPLIGRLSLRRTGAPFLQLIDRFLRFCRRASFEPRTITRHLEQLDLLTRRS